MTSPLNTARIPFEAGEPELVAERPQLLRVVSGHDLRLVSHAARNEQVDNLDAACDGVPALGGELRPSNSGSLGKRNLAT